MATVILRRTPAPFGVVRRLKIFVDGELRITLKHRETKVIELSSGEHVLQARMDWCRSPKVTIDLERDQILKLECGVRSAVFAALAMYVTPFRVIVVAPRVDPAANESLV